MPQITEPPLDECLDSPTGKHEMVMTKSGIHPEYGCKWCWLPMGLKHTCPKCGFKF